MWAVHWSMSSLPSTSWMQVVLAKFLVFVRPVKLGVSSDKMTAVPTHGSMFSFLEAL